MIYFESASVEVGSTHATLYEQELTTPTIFYFELRNDDTSSNGDDLDEFHIDVKLHEDGDWQCLFDEAHFSGLPLVADEQTLIKVVIDSVYAVRFTVASSANNGQNALMRGWYNAT